MDYNVNPFQELYVADSLKPADFPLVFSNVPLESSALAPLFQGGNVVLQGTQGCGKTMLLSLLLPQIRIAFAKAKINFPVAGEASRFIPAGVNLLRSSVCDVAQVTLNEGRQRDSEQLPYYFADFFNYWVIKDLLENLSIIAAHGKVFNQLVDGERLNKFATLLSKEDCWFGVLRHVKDFAELQDAVNKRVNYYRRWVGGNLDVKGEPEVLRTTKSTIGEPLRAAARKLLESQATGEIPVFVRVDQLEELHQMESGADGTSIRLGFRRILNQALAKRDLQVAFRVGTRPYAWDRSDVREIHGSGGRLEERRDYLLIRMDDLFRAREDARSTLFRKFVADAFRRRVHVFLKMSTLPPPNLWEGVFGPSPTPVELHQELFNTRRSQSDVNRLLALDENGWSDEWRSLLGDLYVENPIEALMAAAWGRQTGGRGKPEHRESPPPSDRPWLKKWWVKERRMQTVLQLAARGAQRLLWWGHEDVLVLSGGNITIFIHLCHEVWDQLRKAQIDRPESQRCDPIQGDIIPRRIQASGLQTASVIWFRKISEQPGGDLRQRFIDKLGRYLRSRLRDDKRMSYPGANGFSLAEDDPLAVSPEGRKLWYFLYECAGYGDLVALKHTTKNKAGETRVKFYLHPVLSPYFQIPSERTKEPLYLKTAELMRIVSDSGIVLGSTFSDTARRGGDDSNAEDNRQLRLL